MLLAARRGDAHWREHERGLGGAVRPGRRQGLWEDVPPVLPVHQHLAVAERAAFDFADRFSDGQAVNDAQLESKRSAFDQSVERTKHVPDCISDGQSVGGTERKPERCALDEPESVSVVQPDGSVVRRRAAEREGDERRLRRRLPWLRHWRRMLRGRRLRLVARVRRRDRQVLRGKRQRRRHVLDARADERPIGVAKRRAEHEPDSVAVSCTKRLADRDANFVADRLAHGTPELNAERVAEWRAVRFADAGAFGEAECEPNHVAVEHVAD